MSCEQYNLEESLFSTVEDPKYDHLNISDIEIEETVEINFYTLAHLLVNFNALRGMHDLDWNTIELMEKIEGVELNFDTQGYRSKDFNTLKGMHDLD